MICPNCNSELPEGSEFCPNCGQAFTMPTQSTESPQPSEAISKEEFKAAKAAYKDARKRAGKSNVPRIVASLLALLLAAGGASYGTWRWMSGQTVASSEANALLSAANEKEEEIKEAKERIEELEKEVKAYEDEAKKREEDEKKAEEAVEDASTTDPAEDEKDYVGLWTGKLISTEGSSNVCYGAQGNPVQLVIRSVDATGRMKVDIRLLYHGHDFSDLASDVDSSDGDKMLEFTNLTTTMNNGSFSLNLDVSDISKDASLRVEVRADDQYSSGRQLQVVVRANPGNYASTSTDTYSLTRASTTPELPKA